MHLILSSAKRRPFFLGLKLVDLNEGVRPYETYQLRMNTRIKSAIIDK